MMDLNSILMAVGRPGMTELLIVLVVLLVLFGPKYLPKLGQTLGNSIRGFREGLSADDEVQQTEAKAEDTVKTEA